MLGQPSKPVHKRMPLTECGVESVGDAQVQLPLDYYLLSPFFDLRCGSDFPCGHLRWHSRVCRSGAFIAILVFLFFFMDGLVWAWGKGCFVGNDRRSLKR